MSYVRLVPLVTALAIAPLAAQTTAAGRYDFRSVTQEGDSLFATLYIVGEAGSYGGYVLTNVQVPLPIKSAVKSEQRLQVTAAIRSDIDITFTLDFHGSEFEGTWSFLDQSGSLVGQRVPTNERNDLEPVNCRAPRYSGLVRCAFRWVYENRAADSGRMIPLHIVILPALAEDPEPDPLFHFAGGPGQAATQMTAGNAQRFAAIRQRRDIVMVDQRGTGKSNGLACSFDDAQKLTRAVMAWDLTQDDIERCLAGFEGLADARLYHTAIAMDDIDEVREWLGYERINLYGGSYGTRAALTYLRQYPDRVRTMTIRGVLSPGGALNLDNPRDAQVSIERLFADCDADRDCAAAFPNLRDEFDRVVARLAASPTVLPMTDPRTGDSVRITIDRNVFAAGIRRFLMDANAQRQLPRAIHAAATGDFRIFEPGIRGTLSVFGSLYLGMGLSVVCAEDAPRLAGVDIDEYTSGTFLGGAAPHGIARACAHFPTDTPPDGYDQPVRADAPSLILSGALDPTTPARWGHEVAEALPNSLHLVMEGISHSPFPQCALGIMTAFVESGTVEGLDTACLSELRRLPFDTSGAGPP